MTASTSGHPEPPGQPPTSPEPFVARPPQELPPVPAAPASSTRRGRSGGNALLMVAVLVAAAGIAFAVGRSTAPTSAAAGLTGSGFQGAPNASFVPPEGAQAGPGGLGGSMTLSGTVTSIDGSTLTIQTSSGQTVAVDTSGAAYHTQATATETDLTTGSTIQVTVSGLGSNGRAGAGATPDASAAPAGGGLTASDVTIVAR